MPDRRETPTRNRKSVTDFASQPIYQISEEQGTNGVGALEDTVYCAKLLVGPVKLVVQDRLEEGQNLPVHVVDSGSKEQQRTNHPAVATGSGYAAYSLLSFQLLCHVLLFLRLASKLPFAREYGFFYRLWSHLFIDR